MKWVKTKLKIKNLKINKMYKVKLHKKRKSTKPNSLI